MGRFGSKLIFSLGLSGLFICLVAYALEVSEIMPAQATLPTCASMQYLENQPVPSFGVPKAGCDACKAGIQSAVQEANAVLSSAKGADQAINAGNAASTASTAAGAPTTQDGKQFSAGTATNAGKDALQQQKALADSVSQAAKQCAQKIDSSCSAPMASEDTQAKDASKQSCENMGKQADATSADKAAKADQMAKDANQANKQGEDMKPPSPPSMPTPPAGDQGSPTTPTTKPMDKPVVAPDKVPSAKLDTVKPPETKTSSDISPGEFNNKSQSPSSGNSSTQSDARGLTPSPPASESGRGPSSSPTGVSTSGSGASLGAASNAKNAKDGAKESETKTAKGPAEEDAYGNPTAGLARPTLGLKTTGDELTDLIKPGASASLAGSVGSLASNNTPASFGSPEETLFKRVKTKITKISIDRNMQ